MLAHNAAPKHCAKIVRRRVIPQDFRRSLTLPVGAAPFVSWLIVAAGFFIPLGGVNI